MAVVTPVRFRDWTFCANAKIQSIRSYIPRLFIFICAVDSLAERSKAPDSSSGGAIRVGSNPTAVILFGDNKNLVLTGYTTTESNHVRSCGVTVSTLDSESSDGGSNPPRTFSPYYY